MIIENGSICVKIKAGGGLDKNGNPIRPGAEWGKPIPCNYKANTYNSLGKSNGNNFTIASYVVLIEEQEFNADQIKIYDLFGNEVGEFSIIQVEPLNAVGNIKILV